ncbi:MAG: ABC transporter permease [Bacteroidetes bacterium]|nr:ABC transporter permease [Bacteroidota bacterium]
MIRNHFLAAYRNFLKDKFTGFMSLAGHAVGMACCILIWLYISDELNYNKQNVNYERIYRLNWITKIEGKKTVGATVPIVLTTDFRSKTAGVSQMGRMYPRSGEMKTGNEGAAAAGAINAFQEQNVFFADQSILDIFTIKFLSGTPAGALDKPGKAVITDEMALKYFGTINAVGKTLLYENKLPLLISGVVKKITEQSDVHFDFLISFDSLYLVEKKETGDFMRTDWTLDACYTYVLLANPQAAAATGRSLNQLLRADGTARNRLLNGLEVQPLKNMHLYSSNVDGNQSKSSITYVYLFAAAALLILVIANINFINLSVSRAVRRTMEIGMRKVLGAGKKHLVVQVISENILINLAALVVAFLLSIVALPVLNQLTQKQLAWSTLLTVSNLLIIVFFFIVVSIIAGLYPALFLSRFKPAEALKGKMGNTGKKQVIRKALLTFQFVVSMILIIGAIMIYRQIDYLQNKPLGFKKNQVIVIPIFGSGGNELSSNVDAPLRQRIILLEQRLPAYNRIKGVTAASLMPGAGFVRGLVIPEGFTENNNIFVPWISVDYNFLDVLHMPLVAGRTFSKATGTDHLRAFIINESAVRAFGWKSPEAAIGKKIIRGDAVNGKRGEIIGVIKDFNFNPLDLPMEPMIMDINVPRFSQLAVSIAPDHVNETIGVIRQNWNEIFPERVFEFNFLDKQIDSLYTSQENLSRIVEYFSVIAMILCCSGLFSLAAFLSQQRTREIAIRKILGASIPNILVLLSADFLRIILVAFAIAAPLAIVILYQWLHNFAYHVDITVWIFPLTLFGVALIAFFIVSMQSLKAALLSPVENLRNE